MCLNSKCSKVNFFILTRSDARIKYLIMDAVNYLKFYLALKARKMKSFRKTLKGYRNMYVIYVSACSKFNLLKLIEFNIQGVLSKTLRTRICAIRNMDIN